jgi:hybrid polyketide synthase/nonribosomal peptide synthetase ACE1
MKIVILSLSNTLHHMIIGYHHINMDGMSLEVLLADLQALYNDTCTPLPAVTQYPDFSI